MLAAFGAHNKCEVARASIAVTFSRDIGVYNLNSTKSSEWLQHFSAWSSTSTSGVADGSCEQVAMYSMSVSRMADNFHGV